METRTIECVAFYHEGAKGDYFIQKNKFRCCVDSSHWRSVVNGYASTFGKFYIWFIHELISIMFFEAISASLLVLIVNLIDLFTVSVAILVEGKHGKIYNKCMVKVGSLMLYNLRKVDILKFL